MNSFARFFSVMLLLGTAIGIVLNWHGVSANAAKKTSLRQPSEPRQFTQVPAVGEPPAAAPATKPAAAAARPALDKHPETALADYALAVDPTTAWTIRRQFKLDEGRVIELILTSQTWRRIVWKHQVYLYLPNQVANSKQALLLVDGGAWKPEFEEPAKSDAAAELPGSGKILIQIANALKTPVVIVRQVPQQPIFNGMVEDQIISHTFTEYMKSGERDWPLLLPMVKSAVRAMDAAQAVAKQEWQHDIEKFVVTGASKRGWTTWLTGVIDPRVNGIAPMVIDTLNMGPQMKQQLAYFGKFSEQIEDYTEKGLPKYLTTDRGRQLLKIVDPYEYRAALKLPKLMILGTNDRYWTVDALNLYYDQLVGEKYILYVPNNGHKIIDYPRLLGTLGAFYQQVAGGEALPKLTWKYEPTKTGVRLEVNADPAPREVTLWTAKCATRDFRDSQFEAQTVEFRDGRAVIEQAHPEQGYAAIFVEAMFPRQPLPCPLSTTIRVLGNVPADPLPPK